MKLPKFDFGKYDSSDLENHVHQKIEELEKMYFVTSGVDVPNNFLEQLVEKLKALSEGNKDIILSITDISCLLYHCDMLDNELFVFFVKYLESNWDNSLWRALINAIVLQWRNKDRCRILQNLGNSKIKDNFEKKHLIKASYDFVNDDKGFERLSYYVVQRDISMKQVPGLVMYHSKMNTSQYFYDFATHLFSRCTIEYFDILRWMIDDMNDVNRFTKVVLPLFIIKMDKEKTNIDEQHKNDIIKLAIDKIGRLNDGNLWILGNVDVKSEINGKLMTARQILLKWSFRRTITYFFRQQASDSDQDRIDFWKGYIDKMVETYIKNPQNHCFCIHSSTPNLSQQFGISEGVRFYYWNRPGDAIVMRIGQYSIVEFLPKGAAYFYHSNNNMMSNRVWNRQDSVNDLKQQNIERPTKEDISYRIRVINSSIALEHRGKWQSIFVRWMKYRVI